MRNALFKFLTRLAVHHGNAVLLVATLLTLAAAAVTTRLEVKTNFKDLLGSKDPVAQKLSYLQDNFSALSSVSVLVEGRDPERLVAVGRQIEQRLRAHPDQVRDVVLEQPIDFFLDHGLLFLQEDDLRYAASVLQTHEAALGALLRDPSTLGALALLDRTLSVQGRPAGAVLNVQSRAAANLDLSGAATAPPAMTLSSKLDTRPLFNAVDSELRRMMRETPLPGSTEEMLRSLHGTTLMLDGIADALEQGERLSDADFERRATELHTLMERRMGLPMARFRTSADGTALAFDVVATRNILAVGEARGFLAFLGTELDAVRLANPDVTINTAGMPVMFQEESEAILNNFVLVTVLGFLGILAVFIIGFERVGLPSLSAIPLIMGNIWTFGVVTLVRGEITLFALTFPVLLFGLGVDYAIHLLAGYSEQRRAGLAPPEALAATFDLLGAGLLTGSLTTAMAFLVMLVSGFYGLVDMGFTAGTGVLLALVSMLTVLPALVIKWDLRTQGRGEVLPHVPFRFLSPLGAFVQRNAYPVLALFLTATLYFAYYAPKVGLSKNYTSMLPEGLPSMLTQTRMMELFGVSGEPIAFHAATLEEAERIRLAASKAPSIAEVLSPSILIPADQASKADAIAALAERLDRMAPTDAPIVHNYDASEIDALREHLASLKVSALQMSLLAATLYGDPVHEAAADLRQALNRLDARADPSSAARLQRLDALFAAQVREDFERLRQMTRNRSLTADDLPASLLNQVRGKDGSWLVIVRARGDVWDEEARRAFLDDVNHISADQAGMITAWDKGVRALVSELPGVFAWTSLIIGALVLLDLRSIRHTVLSLVPLGLAMLWTVGVLGVMGMEFNMLSVVSLPLLVGIGIDSSVHMVHRVRHDGDLGEALEHSGKPLILSALTTLIGFGSLMLSSHAGFWGLGFATSVGMFFSLMLSLVLLPALIVVFDDTLLRKREEHP